MQEESTTRGGRLRQSRRTGKTTPTGRKLIVTIGVDTYQQLPPLRNAVNDARSVQQLFVEKLRYQAPFEPLLNGAATQQAINALILDKLRATLQPDDTLVLFFAGHGAAREDTRGGAVGFLAPVEARENEWSSFIRVDSLLDEIGRLPPLHILVIIDTCFSGFALGGTFARQVKAGDSGRPASRRVLTSARADQLAQDGTLQQANSPFSAILLEAFAPTEDSDLVRADFDQDSDVSGIEFGLFVQLEFGKTSQYAQMPDFGAFHHDERGEVILATCGTARLHDNPELIAILRDAQHWLRNKGNRAYLYKGAQLKAANTWRIKQHDADVRDEVDTFLSASRQWRLIQGLAVMGVAIVLLGIAYLVGDFAFKQYLRGQARAESAEFQSATVRLGNDETPVTIDAFRLDIHEVSARQYHLCYRAGACEKPAGIPDYDEREHSVETGQLPIGSVTAFNARDYCAWQGGRLPTVAEWEYAARGTEYRPWPWGDEPATTNHVNVKLTDIDEPFQEMPVPVQDPNYSKGVTPNGIWHLIGNVREWTSTRRADCPLQDNQFVAIYDCETWDGGDSITGLFLAGFSSFTTMKSTSSHLVSEYIDYDATEKHRDFGFRCAYE